jgi:hypothetical protein
VTVFHDRGASLKPLRARALPEDTGEVLIPGLPPGELVAQIQSADRGTAFTRLTLSPGQVTDWSPDVWQLPRQLVIEVRDPTGAPCPSLPVDIWFTPRGRSPKIKQVTNADGRALCTLAGSGRLAIACELGAWVTEVAENQTFVSVHCPDSRSGELQLVCAGWWRNKVDSVGVIRAEPGPLYSHAPPGDDLASYRIRRGNGIAALALQLVDGSVVFWSDGLDSSTLVLDEPPQQTLLEVVANGDAATPYAMEPHVIEVGGVSVEATMLSNALGGPVRVDRTFAIHQCAPLRLCFNGLGAHGGVVARAQISLNPGLDKRPILRLENLR